MTVNWEIFAPEKNGGGSPKQVDFWFCDPCLAVLCHIMSKEKASAKFNGHSLL